MATIGETLRKAREAQGLTVEWVASELKLRADYIRALEEDRLDVFAAPVYAKGAIRSYARLLKLDEIPLLQAADEMLGRIPKYRDLTTTSAIEPSLLNQLLFGIARLTWRRWFLLIAGLILAFVCVVLVVRWSGGTAAQPQQIKPSVVEPARIPGERLPVPPVR